jgi:hypothetical protein
MLHTKPIRPSTAQTQPRSSSESFTPVRSTFGFLDASSAANGHATPAVMGLPPPPRRRGAAVSSEASSLRDRRVSDMSAPAMSLISHASSMPATPLRADEMGYASNTNTFSVYRKPSFLNIDDDPNDPARPMSSVPEDSFLILDGKDSLDLGSSAR